LGDCCSDRKGRSIKLRHSIDDKEDLVPSYNYVAVIFAAAICFIIQPALAHPKLMATISAADAQAQSPQEIRLSFSEALITKFSDLHLKDQEGKHVETGPAASDPKDRKHLIVPIKAALAPGRYTVEWHVVAEDTHRIKGSYSFEVKP
jgi:methionine-rich copper-binding protein CopC